MSVRCSWCGKYGHNRRGCPDLNRYIQENPNSSEARKARHQSESRKRTVRRCSYCESTGHNRKTCKYLKDDKAKVLKRDISYRKSFMEALKSAGLGIGSLVSLGGEVSISWGEREYVDYIVLTTGIKWGEVNLSMDRVDMSNSYTSSNLGLLTGRIVGVKMTPEVEEKCKEALKESEGSYRRYGKTYAIGSEISITAANLYSMLPKSLFSNTIAPPRSAIDRKTELIGKSGSLGNIGDYLTRDINQDLQETLRFTTAPQHKNDPWYKQRSHMTLVKYIPDNDIMR